MNHDLEKEELQSYFYDFLDENHVKIQNLSEKCFSLYPNSIQFIETSSKLSGYFSANTWLINNFDCNSSYEFHARILSFEQLLNNHINKEVENNIKISFYTKYYYDDLKTYHDSLEKEGISSIPFSYENIDKYFENAKEKLELLFSNKSLQSLENICHFQIYTGKILDDWNIEDYYKAILANHQCLKLLQELHHNISTYKNNKKENYK